MSPFKPIKRDTDFLFPPSINDWLPEQHLARFVVEIVEQLNLKNMERAYRGTGSTPFHPALLLAILVYGYATGVFSSRKLENATYDSVAFRYMAADEHPDPRHAEHLPQAIPERDRSADGASPADRPHHGPCSSLATSPWTAARSKPTHPGTAP